MGVQGCPGASRSVQARQECPGQSNGVQEWPAPGVCRVQARRTVEEMNAGLAGCPRVSRIVLECPEAFRSVLECRQSIGDGLKAKTLIEVSRRGN